MTSTFTRLLTCFAACFGLLFLNLDGNAQTSTFSKVHDLLVSNCGNSCHGDAFPAGDLSLYGPEQDVYDRLVNILPQNTYAAEKGFALIKPGYPDQSFLFRKIQNGMYSHATLTASEGEAMPQYMPPLDEVDIEVLREWIYFGAPVDGEVDHQSVIEEYYATGGLPKLEAPAPPPEGEGFQLHFGPLWMQPFEETEVLKKHDLELEEGLEINRLELKINDYSHHFILYKYPPDVAGDFSDETKVVSGLGEIADHALNTTYVVASQNPYRDLELPDGTAFFWEPGSALSLNYHLYNYSSGILPAEVYINVYTQEAGTADKEMKSNFATYGWNNPFLLNIPGTGDTVTLQMSHTSADLGVGEGEIWNIWQVQGHTHKHGVGFNIHLRNEDGSWGERIYDGNYNFDYTENLGFFDWGHPPIRTFEPQFSIEMDKGLWMEAKYLNNSGSNIGFGLTTEDEMFVTYYLYTVDFETNAGEPGGGDPHPAMSVSPNPVGSFARFGFELPHEADVQLNIFNAIGQQVHTLVDGHLPKGKHTAALNAQIPQLSRGLYVAQLKVNGQTAEVKKFFKD